MEPASNVTFVGLFGAAITTLADGLAGVMSLLVLRLKVVFANVCADGFVTPPIVTVAAVFALSAHVPPLFARVIVTVCDETEPVAEQLVNPVGKVIVGDAGTKKALGKTAVIVSPATRAPVVLFAALTLEVKPTVHVVCALPVCEAALKATFVGVVAKPTITFDEGLSADESELVRTLNVLERSVPLEPGLTIPGIDSDAAVFTGTTHVPPLFASVIVTVVVDVEPVAVQFVNPVPRLIVGVEGIVRPELNRAVIVLPAPSAPLVADVVKPTVQVESALCCCGRPLNEAAAGVAPAVIATEASLTEPPSLLVETARVTLPAVLGFVMPAI